MAKSKRKNNRALRVLKYCAILFAIVGIIMAAFSFVNYGDSSFTGFQVIFGYTATTGSIVSVSTKVLSFSIIALLTILLPLIGSLSVICKNKIIRLLGALLMIAGTVMCFFVPNFVVFANDSTKTAYSLFSANLGVGAIIAGILFGLGSLCNLFAVVEK